MKVHRAVALAFLGEPPPGQEVRHKDGDPGNAELSNLEYGTRSENMRDAVRHGTHHETAKTHCKRGHQFDEANTIVTHRQRICRTCRDEAGRRAYARRKAAA